MEEKNQTKAYDYRTIRINRHLETITVNAYESLGWEITGSNFTGGAFVTLSFKRDRKLANKQNLMQLQEKAESKLQEIEMLHIKKKKAGLMPALATGILGTLAFGGGMSMTMEMGGAVGLAVGTVLGLVGIGICALAWPINKNINAKNVAKFDTLIENEYNKLTELCNQAKV